tara:strand:+ start:47 stop:1033 length:987 start_codon:yes stop_codon:yes gene_type:complete
MKDIKLICTIGPSTFSKNKLLQLKKLNIDLFRINLSHTKVKDLERRIKTLKNLKITNKICIDTEGAQIRTTLLPKRNFKTNQIVYINKKNKNKGNKIGFYPNFDFYKLKTKSQISIGFENLKLRILKITKNIIKTVVINDGFVESNKGVHLSKNIKLNALTKKDIESIVIAKKLNIKNYALSFANSAYDVLKFRQLIGGNSNLISKIETSEAVKNLDKIIRASDKILIDRGDLSRYVPIENIPIVQMQILKKANLKKKKCYVATNLLESMVKQNQPTRAESNDIFSTLEKGADGLVLAAETAKGKYPIECVKFIRKCIKTYNNFHAKR